MQLTEKARPLLRGEFSLQFRHQARQELSRRETKSKKKSGLHSADEALFNKLRDKRLAIAQTMGVPPYIIFHDSSLQQMATERPSSLNDMSQISGVGDKKLAQYGQDFLDVILANPLPALLDNQLSNTINDTLLLHSQGKSMEAIASQRELNLSTVFSHLAEAIEVGLLDARQVLPISDAQYQEIVNAMELMSGDDEKKLKPVYEALDQAYDYGILRCVQASLSLSLNT